MEIEKFAKWAVGLAAAAGFLVIIAKDGQQIGQFMQASSDTVVSFGKGIGSIAG